MRIFTCQEWGAAPKDTSRLARTPAQGIVIHHTTTPDVPPLPGSAAEQQRCFRLARGIQSAHLGRGWKDTGQNFTCTRSGLLLEGRHGSLAAAQQGRVVQGSHAGNKQANRERWGIENEGLYTSQLPPAALWNALVELCAWLCLWGDVDSQAIHGHREYKSTQCPGDAFFARLGDLRAAVHTRKLELMRPATPP
jgi:hypothetical protein